jgi:hypothetical protein
MRTQEELDRLRERAIALRREGKSRREIKQILGPMSNSTLKRAADVAAAATEVGQLTDRDVLIAGAVAYWCEGTKRKPQQNFGRVVFMNSDAGLIRFFLRFLATVGVKRSDLTFCVCIHESADVGAAHRYWQHVTGAPSEQFTKPTLKRHNPKTNRKNVGHDYHGCLRVSVHRSNAPYRRIEGWALAAMGDPSHHGVSVEPTLPAPGEGFEPSLAEPKSAVLPD